MQVNETGILSLACTQALEPYRRVKCDATYGLGYAGATDKELGTLQRRHIVSGLGSDEVAAVVARNVKGSVLMVAAGAFDAFATVYGAADGKVDDTPNGNPIGVALEAATANNDQVEVMRFEAAGATDIVEAHTAGDTLTAAESGSVHTNTGAGATITLVLPPATVGLKFAFGVGAAQQLRLDPNGTETISLPSTGVPGAAGKYLVADAIGETVSLECCVAGNWNVMGYTGTWTAEA